MSCPTQSVPLGWRTWQGPVPTELTQMAMDIRDHVRSYPVNSIAKTIQYNGQTVGFWISMHDWTYKNGVLLTGICIMTSTPGTIAFNVRKTTSGTATVRLSSTCELWRIS